MKFNAKALQKINPGFFIIDSQTACEMAPILGELTEKRIYPTQRKVEKSYFYFKSVSRSSTHSQ